jgi:two-component system, OmpR family, sensor histidine kinase CpxA
MKAMRLRASLFARILLWSFLNLAVAGSVLYAFFALQFKLEPDSVLFAGNRLQYVAARLSVDSRGAATPASRDALLARYSASYQANFLLFSDDGTQLGGARTALPASVLAFIKEERAGPRPGARGQAGDRVPGPSAPPGQIAPPPPPPGGERNAPPPVPPGKDTSAPPVPPGDRPPPSIGDGFRPGSRGQRGGGPDRMGPPGEPIFRERTTGPPRYWVSMRVPLFEPGERRPSLAFLVVVSDSMSGHGLFFDVRPWLFVAAAVVVLSMLIWFPFVRGLTVSIGQMTAAAEEIARGRFDSPVTAHRSDELGRLAAAINQMSARLAGFVGGQRRFLGDISHELNTPLARLDVALGILEGQVEDSDRAVVADAQDEVRLMSQLVAELLAFAKAGMKGQEVRLSSVPLRPVCEAVVAREAQGREVRVDVDPALTVRGQPQLLARALANLVRNALRYAGQAGPIAVSARPRGEEVAIAVSDRGPGVPDETMPRLFEPFFRIEADRDRATGGAGLGLAIVKTCVDACQGRVEARNLAPGFEVEIVLGRG